MHISANRAHPTPFALSLSKGSSFFVKKDKGFDRLSLNGIEVRA
ncbi:MULTISPECIES: hypothetical protein [unclassified Sphingobium]